MCHPVESVRAMDPFLRDVRLYVYEQMVETSAAPTAAETAMACRARRQRSKLEQTWALARLWYADRMDPAWLRRSPADATRAFAEVGLRGEFWSLG